MTETYSYSRREQLANTVREARLSRGLSLPALGTELGVHRTTITEWEQGRSLPTDSSCEQIEAFLRRDHLACEGEA